MSVPVIWLLVGAALIVFEVTTAPGIGVFVAGLGAFCTAFALQSELINVADFAGQFICFAGSTTLFAVVLWKRLKKFRATHSTGSKQASQILDMVGSRAVIAKGGLHRGQQGQVMWSGTLMTATLDPHAPMDFLPEGTPVEIRAVTGTIVTVSPSAH